MATSHKLYLGYDLGDGETQISKLSPDQEFPESLRMPTTTGNNQPIITAYSVHQDKILLGNDVLGGDVNAVENFYVNFKVKPTELIKTLPDDAQATIRKMCKAHNIQGILGVLKQYENSQMLMAKCVREFTNAIFTHEYIASSLISYQDKCDEISLFIGHPTKWDQDDILIYKAMLGDSILGQGELVFDGCHISLTFDVEKESRAAFLYGRKEYGSQLKDGWKIEKYSLVIDVGSSTLDVSAMSGLESDNVLDDGNPFLGARLIDKAIYHYYRKVLSKNGELSNLDRLIQENPTVEKLFILACRKAKELYFSSQQTLRVLSPLESVTDIKIPRPEMDSILAMPLSELDDKGEWIDGRNSWEKEFESFLKKQKETLDKKGKIVDRIILTGGAARMGFVQEACRRVFNNITILYDSNPGIAISHGLALVGRSNEKSVQFRQEAESLLGDNLRKLVTEKIPNLAKKLSQIIASIILDDIAFTELKRWKSRSHYTLNGAISAIKGKCTENNLKTKLTSSSSYNQTLQKWVKDDLIDTINSKLLNLCYKYGLTDFEKKDVDITTVPIDGTKISEISSAGKVISDDILNPADALAAIVAIVSGIVTFTVVPTVLYIVISLVLSIAAAISTTLAWIIASILALIPGAGWTLLAVLAGVGVFVLVANGWESMKEKISTSMMSYDLPQWVRDRVDNDKIKSALNDSRSDVTSKVERELKSPKSSNEIAEQVADALFPQIEKKIQEIRYIIESR